MTAANGLTLMRAFLSLPLAWAILAGPPTAAAALFAVGALSDGVDGYLARRSGTITRFGQLADPVADKLFGTTALLTLCVREGWTLWIPGVLIAKEIALLCGGLWIWRIEGRIIPARFWGKAATAVLFSGLALAVAGVAAAYYVVCAGVLLSLWAGIAYAATLRR